MALPVINTRDDLDAIVGTPEHDEFVVVLRGTLWRLEKDDEAQAWVAVEDNTTVERFGFVRADFPDAQPPELPAYVAPPWSPSRLLKVVKAGREIALNRLAGIAFAAREGSDGATVTACLAARQSLLDITKLPAVLAATDDASLTAAIGAGYEAIVGACPSNIVSAFAGIQA